MLVTCQRFGDWFLFGLVWQYSSIQKNITKVGAMSWMLTCSCHIALSLPFYTDPDSKRELNFCNGYLSLLHFWHYSSNANSPLKWQKINQENLAFQMRLQNLVLPCCVLFWIFLNLADDVTLSPNQGDQQRDNGMKYGGTEPWQTYLFLPHKFSQQLESKSIYISPVVSCLYQCNTG